MGNQPSDPMYYPSPEELTALNKSLFPNTACIISDCSIYNNSISLQVVSQCGSCYIDIPGDRLPSAEVICAEILKSDEYQSILLNTMIGYFNKASLVYVFNKCRPLAENFDSYSIKSINTASNDGVVEIMDVDFYLHEYGSYSLWPQPELLKAASTHSMYEIVSLILDRIIDENMNLGDWSAPTEAEVAALANHCPKIDSAEQLLKYATDFRML